MYASHRLAVIATQNIFSYILAFNDKPKLSFNDKPKLPLSFNDKPNLRKIKSAPNDLKLTLNATRP